MRPDDLSRPVKIHCCKDGTVTVRLPGQPVFNGRALPVYSCNTEEEARALVIVTCAAMHHEHPLLQGQTWYKINGNSVSESMREDGLPVLLEIEHLNVVTERLRAADYMMRERAGAK